MLTLITLAALVLALYCATMLVLCEILDRYIVSATHYTTALMVQSALVTVMIVYLVKHCL